MNTELVLTEFRVKSHGVQIECRASSDLVMIEKEMKRKVRGITELVKRICRVSGEEDFLIMKAKGL